MRIPGSVGPAYALSTVPLDCQVAINFYLEPDELQTGKDGSIGALVCRPDLTVEAILPLSPVRGLWRVSSTGQVFGVGGNGLYEIHSDMSVTKVGSLKTDTGAVSMSDNGLQLIVVDGIYGHILTLSNGIFAPITAPAFYSSKKAVFTDTYFVLVRPDSDQIYQSDSYDGYTYGALDFTTADANPDKTVTVLPYRNQLAVFGERSTAFYANSGGAAFAFDRIPGALIEHGCAAPLSPAKDGDTLVWLGEDEYGAGVVYKAVGYQAMRASNYGVELAIQGYGDVSDATGFMFQMRGHTFYVLSFPSANTSWVMDVGLGTWYEWKSAKDDGSQGPWRASTHVWAFGKHLVGDFENGKIYSLGFSSRKDDGKTIQRRRRIPPVSNNLKRMIHSKVQLDCRTGVGTDGTTLGQQPTVMLRYSDDGGISWSSEKWQPLGRIGQTYARAIWRMLGQSRNRVYEFTVTDPVDVAIMGVDLDAQPCGS
jgi:hypothetical protein